MAETQYSVCQLPEVVSALLNVLDDINSDRCNNDHAFYNLLPVHGNPENNQRVVHESQNQYTGQNTANLADATAGGYTADDAHRNGVKFPCEAEIIGCTALPRGLKGQ